MAFHKCTSWQLINNFTLKDGDLLHTCVPQQIILMPMSIGAQYSIRRDHAHTENEPSPQVMTREITGSGNLKDSDVQIFSLESGLHGRLSRTDFRILPADTERTKAVDKVNQWEGFSYTGLSAKTVPEGGLMGNVGGLLEVYKSPRTDDNGIWRSSLSVFLPEEKFDPLFKAIASAPHRPKSMRLIARVNLFEMQVDASLNDGPKTFGVRLMGEDADGMIASALLDGFEITFSPSAM